MQSKPSFYWILSSYSFTNFSGLTAIEIWMIVCVLFVFGALSEYAGVLLQVKIAAAKNCSYNRRKKHLDLNTVEKGVVLVHRNTSSIYKNKVNILLNFNLFHHIFKISSLKFLIMAIFIIFYRVFQSMRINLNIEN